MDAAGTFTQTGITSIETRQAGPTTMIEQTSHGLVAGTLSGTYQDELLVVIRPNGTFTARYARSTLDCGAHATHGAEVITGTDVSCLMHLQGLIRRDGLPLRVMHVAEILNGNADG